jgi:hypothetical protein
MTETIAKQIVKNKFWIVEESGEKIATIQAIDEGGVAYVRNDQREVFPSIKLLSKKYNIEFARVEKKSKRKTQQYDVYGYPTATSPYNALFNVARHLPIYTQTPKSRSFFCAGYYVIDFNHQWITEFCPKAITLNRYPYQGPFVTESQATEKLEELNGK